MKNLLLVCCLISLLTYSCQTQTAKKKTEPSATETVEKEKPSSTPSETAEKETSPVKIVKANYTENDLGEILLHASGTEPFWHMKIGKDRSMLTSLGLDTFFYDTKKTQSITGRPENYMKVYDFEHPKNPMKVFIKNETLTNDKCFCSDGMSDNDYVYTVILLANEFNYEGCGSKPKAEPN